MSEDQPMRVSLGLPTHRVDHPELLGIDGIARLSREAEAAGFDAVYVTEHPFPAVDWLDAGGHHALDPIVALSVAAAASVRLGLHTNLFLPALRNPFLAAKAIASLDVVSNGRVILGVGAGYLEAEFDALGADFADRNDGLDRTITAMREAWSGETVTGEDPAGRWRAVGNRALPRPERPGGPPIFVGGNSRRAMRRAVELGAGWTPFPAGGRTASVTRTAVLRTAEQLAERVSEAVAHAESVGRPDPLEIGFVPDGLSMLDDVPTDHEAVLTSCNALAEAGTTWVTVAFPAVSVEGQVAEIRTFGAKVLPQIATLEPGLAYRP